MLGLGGGLSLPPMPFASVGTSRSGVMKRWLQGTPPHPISTPQHYPYWLVDWQARKTNYVGLDWGIGSVPADLALRSNLPLKIRTSGLGVNSPVRYQSLNITHIGLWIGKLGKQIMLGWAGEFASNSSHLLLHLNLHLKFGSCEARIGGKLPCPMSIPQHYPFIF